MLLGINHFEIPPVFYSFNYYFFKEKKKAENWWENSIAADPLGKLTHVSHRGKILIWVMKHTQTKQQQQHYIIIYIQEETSLRLQTKEHIQIFRSVP